MMIPRTTMGRTMMASAWCVGLLFGACQVPTTHSVAVGKRVSLETDAKVELTRGVVDTLSELPGVDNVSVSVSESSDGPNRIDLLVWGRDVSSPAILSTLRAAMPAADGARVTVEDLEGTLHEKLGDRLGRDLFKFEIDADTEDEIRHQVLQQLAEHGFSGNAAVSVSEEDGHRVIQIDTSGEQSKDSMTYELKN